MSTSWNPETNNYVKFEVKNSGQDLNNLSTFACAIKVVSNVNKQDIRNPIYAVIGYILEVTSK